jgi:methyl-accepting chemotaxis protein
MRSPFLNSAASAIVISKSIQTKIIFWAGMSLSLVAGIVIFIAALTLRNTAIENAKRSTLEIARKEANYISDQLSSPFDIARTLTNVITTAKTQASGLTREQIDSIIKEVLVNNPNLAGSWTVWEPNAFDGLDKDYVNAPGYDRTGRFIVYWNRDAEGTIKRELVVDYEDGTVDWYRIPKESQQETILDPYVYVIQGKDTLLTSFAIPIVIDNRFIGLVGVDYNLSYLQGIVENLQAEYTQYSEIMLISNRGKVVAVSGHPDWVGGDLSQYHSNAEQELALVQNQEQKLIENNSELSVYEPIGIGRTTTPWSISLKIPYDVVTAEASRLTWQLVGVSVAMTVVGLLLLWFLARQIAQPIKAVTAAALGIVNGDLSREVDVVSTDETGVLANAFNQMVSRLRTMLNEEQAQRTHLQNTVEEYADHMNRIGQGNLRDRLVIKAHDQNKHDPLITLGHKLNDMTSNLHNLINEMQQVALKVNVAGSQIQSALTQQTASVIEQEATIAQTLMTFEEIRSVVAQTADVAQNVAKASQQSVEVSRHGEQAVLASIEGMSAVGQRVKSIAETILLLSKHTQQIGEITESVNDIAEQSKLLALNASIEAAREA